MAVSRIHALTGLRGVCCLIVVVSHSMDRLRLWSDSMSIPARESVALFFTFSGYLLSQTYRGCGDFSDSSCKERFWYKRFIRIYPLYLVLYLVQFIVQLLYTPFPIDTSTVFNMILSLLLIQTWFTVPTIVAIPSWTLNVEMVGYVVFPWIMRHC
ncbi:MAG: acyltransferase, partial [Proteobacteria bacterium]|nr:acyltransferase [Pseudomonadota bacterium]